MVSVLQAPHRLGRFQDSSHKGCTLCAQPVFVLLVRTTHSFCVAVQGVRVTVRACVFSGGHQGFRVPPSPAALSLPLFFLPSFISSLSSTLAGAVL